MDELISRKSFKYGTRHLVAGDLFLAKPKDARLLVAAKRAERPKAETAPPQYEPVEPERNALDDTHKPLKPRRGKMPAAAKVSEEAEATPEADTTGTSPEVETAPADNEAASDTHDESMKLGTISTGEA